MAKYIALNELPSKDALMQPLRGNEPDIALAYDMLQNKIDNFMRHQILWDIVLPEGADDNNRIELNASRMRTIRHLGGYSLVHFIDSSNQNLPSGYLDDGSVERGICIGLNVKDLIEWTRGRYRRAIPLMRRDSLSTAEDAFWADEIENIVGDAFEMASQDVPSARRTAAAKVAQLPGLFRINSTSDRS